MRNLLLLLTIHFVADFVLQTNWQAQNKSKNWAALFLHVGTYSACFIPFAWWLFGPSFAAIQFVTITFWLHFITDAITSRINSSMWRANRVHAFFVGVGADQLSHAYALAVTLWVFTR